MMYILCYIYFHFTQLLGKTATVKRHNCHKLVMYFFAAECIGQHLSFGELRRKFQNYEI